MSSADPLLDELLAHCRRHNLFVLEADARALRARRALLGGSEDNAMTEVAVALAMLDREPRPDLGMGKRAWERLLAIALIDTGWVLTQLGIYEMAEEVMDRAQHRIREGGGPHEITVHMINRCRMLLGWGLRLERIGMAEAAQQRFDLASQIAVAVEVPWRESLFPRDSHKSAAEQMPILSAAHALAGRCPHQVARLRMVAQIDRATRPREKIIFAIAFARCLVRGGNFEEALQTLASAREEFYFDNTEPSLRISLAREYAQLAKQVPSASSASHAGSEQNRHDAEEPTQIFEAAASESPEDQAAAEDSAAGSSPSTGHTPTASSQPERSSERNETNALYEYVIELEDELWSMREARYRTLETRLEHARLSREHGYVARQALQDPLTGLLNRRALNEQLDSLLRQPDAQPLAVALVDLDGFKEVNDTGSHAEGDDVLRVVANALREALRVDDIVARYGGDEFVVLLPGVPLVAAEQALGRAVNAIASMPEPVSRGVTLSVGVVGMLPEETSEQILSRADAAMYSAKSSGGNTVSRG